MDEGAPRAWISTPISRTIADWGATLSGLGAHLAEHHEGDDEAAAARYRRLLEARAGDPVGAGRAGTHRLADGRRARAGAPGRGGRRSQRRRGRARGAGDARRGAGRDGRARSAAGGGVWRGGRSRPCPGYAPAVHLLERLYADARSVGRAGEGRRGRRRRPARRPRERSGAGRDAARARRPRASNALGALYEERLQDPGKALALYSEWAELGERRAGGVARAAARRREGGRRAGRGGGGAEAGHRDSRSCPAEARFAWCYRAAVIYEERAAADDEAVRAYEAALALDPSFAAGAGGAGARALPQPPAGGAGGGAVASRRRPSRTRAAPARWLSRRRASTRSRLGRVDDALAATSRALSLRSGERGRHRRARAPAGAHGRGATSWPRRWAAWRRRWPIRSTRRRPTGCRRRSSSGSSGPSARRWRPSSARRAAMSAERHSGAAAIRIALQRLYQLVGRGARAGGRRAARVSVEGQRGAATCGRSLDLAWRLGDPEAALAGGAGGAGGRARRRGGAGRGGDAGDEAGARSRPRAGAGEAGGVERRRRDRRGACCARRPRRARARPRSRTRRCPRRCRCCARVVETHATEDALAVLERQATRAGEWALRDPGAPAARRASAPDARDARRAACGSWGTRTSPAGDLRGADADFTQALEADATLPAGAAGAGAPARGDGRRARGRRAVRPRGAPDEGAGARRRRLPPGGAPLRQPGPRRRDGRALPGGGARARARGGDRLRGAGRHPARARRRRAPGAGHAPARRRRADAEAARSAARARGSDLRARSDRSGVGAGRGGRRWIRRRCRRWSAWPRSRPRSGAPPRRSRPIGWRSPRRRIRRVVGAAWARIGDIAERALADVGQAVDAYRNALLSTPDDLPRAGGAGARARRASATGRTRRRRCAGWPPSRAIATRASDTWSRSASCWPGRPRIRRARPTPSRARWPCTRATTSRWIAWTRS